MKTKMELFKKYRELGFDFQQSMDRVNSELGLLQQTIQVDRDEEQDRHFDPDAQSPREIEEERYSQRIDRMGPGERIV